MSGVSTVDDGTSAEATASTAEPTVEDAGTLSRPSQQPTFSRGDFADSSERREIVRHSGSVSDMETETEDEAEGEAVGNEEAESARRGGGEGRGIGPGKRGGLSGVGSDLRRRKAPSRFQQQEQAQGSSLVDGEGATPVASSAAAAAAAAAAQSQQAQGPGQPSHGPHGKKVLRASSPAHWKPRESPLSSDAIFTQSHAGLFNLCIVLLVAVNSRLIIENIMKYGILIRAGFWFGSGSLRDWPLLMCGLSLAAFPLLALLIELLEVHHKLPPKTAVVLHMVNISVEFLYPAVVINRVQSQPLGGFILIFIAVTIMMKLISYAHTNYDARRRAAVGDKTETAASAPTVAYPDNLTLPDMLYFIAAPTLCYQLGYPRSPHGVRKGWVVQQLITLVTFAGLMLFIIEQYINPIIQNSDHPFKGHLVESIERVLKLSIPTLYVWLCMFFCFFHLWLNILGELLCFGDREFYRDWWNACTIEEYWKLWNMPVHRWMVRHVYFPCISIGCNKATAMFVVFFLSAVFHEVIIGIPCHMVRFWAFLGMIFQIPLVLITGHLYRKFKNPMVGNMLFWFFFCIVGQPICVLLYYHDVQLQLQQQRAPAA